MLKHHDLSKSSAQVHLYGSEGTNDSVCVSCIALIALCELSEAESAKEIFGPKSDSFPGLQLMIDLMKLAREKNEKVALNICVLLLW